MDPNENRPDPRGFVTCDALDRRVLAKLGRWGDHPVGVFVSAAVLLWLPLYVLWRVDLALGVPPSTRFVDDYAAYAQFLLGVPLLIVARRIIDFEWRTISDTIRDSRLLTEDAQARFSSSEGRIRAVLGSRWLNIAIVGVGYALSTAWFFSELFNDHATYHAVPTAVGIDRPTLAGLYCWLVSVPAYTGMLAYWVTRYGAWCAFLRALSRCRPRLVGHHVDRTGGLRFLSQTISSFGLLIFAIGAVQVAITFHKLEVEGETLSHLEVLAAPLAFGVLAPLVFILPFFFFTRQLYEARTRALKDLNRLGFAAADRLVGREGGTATDTGEVPALGDLATAYEIAQQTRIWPLDLGSLGRLFFSALAPMLPLMAEVLGIPRPLQLILEALAG